MDVMVDLETLGVRPDAAIIQIGAVMFEPVSGGKVLNGKAFSQHVLVQDGAGSVDHSTLAWWLREASAAQMGQALEERAEPLQGALRLLVEWPETVRPGLDWSTVNGVWAKDPSFDLAMLKTAFARFGAEPPWHYQVVRCVRTLFWLAGGEPPVDRAGFTAHDAADDAVTQAMQVQKAMTALGRR